MNNGYAYDFDYDNYRYTSTNHPTRRAETKGVPLQRWVIILLVALLLLGLGWYSLRYIPLFDINQVVLSAEGNIAQLPNQVREIGEKCIGKSLFSSAPRQLRRTLESLAYVKEVSLKKRSFNTLELNLILYPSEIEIEVREGGNIKRIYLLIEGKLCTLEGQVSPITKGDSLVVTIESSYEADLLANGFSNELNKAVEIATKLRMEGMQIGQLDYSPTVEGGQGATTFHFKQLNCALTVFEPISESRSREALQLIKLERDNGIIALGKEVSYDLDGRSLIRRQ